MTYEIAERDDMDALCARVTKAGRVQARRFLEAQSATRLAEDLTTRADWRLTYNAGENAYEATQDEVAAAGTAQMDALVQSVYERGRENFQYLFEHDPVSERLRRGESEVALKGVHDWLNSGPFVAFLQDLTGVDAGPDAHVDVYVTRYSAGHFLSRHDDSYARADRRAAFVINLSRDWRPDWGGQLAFFDENGDIENAFTPAFNVLNVFVIPADHSVLPVAPFAGGQRLSISGWLRADKV